MDFSKLPDQPKNKEELGFAGLPDQPGFNFSSLPNQPDLFPDHPRATEELIPTKEAALGGYPTVAPEKLIRAISTGEMDAVRKFILAGGDPKSIEDELEGLQVPVYDFADMVADLATFGITAAGRIALKQVIRTGSKQALKTLGRGTAREVAYGGLVGGSMVAAEEWLDAGPLVQMLSGLIGPVATASILTMGRKSLATYLRHLKQKNPTVHKKLTKTAKAHSGLPMGKKLQQALYESEQLVILPRKTTAQQAREFYRTVPQSSEAAAVKKMYEKADLDLQRLRKPGIKKTFSKIREGLVRGVVDVSGNIRRKLLKEGGEVGRDAVMHHDLIRGATARATREIETAIPKIYKNLAKGEEKLLNEVIQSRRTITIDSYKKGVRHPGGLGGVEHKKFIESIPPGLREKLEDRADLYFDAMRNQLTQLKQAGLLTPKQFRELVKFDYSPRQFIQYMDPEVTHTFGKRTITVPDSGIAALKEGSEQTLEQNSRKLLAAITIRTQGRIFRNTANQALFRVAETIPENGIVRILKPIKRTKTGKLIYPKPPAGESRISVMIGGTRRDMALPSKLAREWVESDPQLSASFAQLIGWASGSKILRAAATGYNPEFAVANMPRDIAHIWLVTHEYSKFAPKWLAQLGRDLGATAKDAFLRKGAYADYIDEGGGMSFLAHQGRIAEFGPAARGIREALKDVQGVLGYLGETSELWTRLALRNRALRNGKSAEEATWIARNYLDFAQGGSAAKAVDAGVPYFNAAIQATRGLARAGREAPGELTWKFAQLAGISGGLMLANRHVNPDCWNSIPEHEKINNFIFTTPLTYKDRHGETRYIYFRVPKDQPQRLLCTVVEGLISRMLGEAFNLDAVAEAAKQIAPWLPESGLPPALSAMFAYTTNKDFWTNEDIWTGPEVEAWAEYWGSTNPALREMSKITGMSPERMKRALQKVFTYRNIYTDTVGWGFRKLLESQGEQHQKETLEALSQTPFMRRLMRGSYPYAQYEKTHKEAVKKENTRRHMQNLEIAEYCRRIFVLHDDTARQEAGEYLGKQPLPDRTRLEGRMERYARFKDTANPSFWFKLSEPMMLPAAQARIFFDKWLGEDEAGRLQLGRDLRAVKGIGGPQFLRAFYQLREDARKRGIKE